MLNPAIRLENIKYRTSSVECYWPKYYEDNAINEYVSLISGQQIRRRELFRTDDTPKSETVFSSPGNREVVEKLFLRVGIKLLGDANLHENMRPLGFDYLDPLGFGSLFISHRNIANNCPMALWFNSKKPGSGWYPLLLRKHNFEDKNWS